MGGGVKEQSYGGKKNLEEVRAHIRGSRERAPARVLRHGDTGGKRKGEP